MPEPRGDLRPLWYEPGRLILLDQRVLPHEERYLEVRSAEAAFEAIREMAVRGAPLIGVTAAYGVAAEAYWHAGEPDLRQHLQNALRHLAEARPTAVNLRWALERLRRVLEAAPDAEIPARMEAEARRLEQEERERCEAIARHGLALVPEGARILTICNTGRLATPGIGTALGIIYRAFEAGRVRMVYVPETRPWLQGARLTTFELSHAGVPHRLIVDSMAPYLISLGQVDLVIVGADRIARNGDTANKIGTLSLALAARQFGVPFYVAAPLSSFDLSLASGREIPVEERAGDEVRRFQDCATATPEVATLNYAFDITPGDLITGFITEQGLLTPPFDTEEIAR